MRQLSLAAVDPPQTRRRITPEASARTVPALGMVLLAFAAVYVIWGSTYLGIHLAIQSIPPFLMAGGPCWRADCSMQ